MPGAPKATDGLRTLGTGPGTQPRMSSICCKSLSQALVTPSIKELPASEMSWFTRSRITGR